MDRGTYDLQVRSAGHEQVCLDVPGIVVEPGPCRDERLRHISVLAMARSVRVRLRTPADAKTPGPRGVALIRPRVDRGRFEVVPVVARGGELAFFVAETPVDIRICLDGYQPLDLPPESFDVVVDLVERLSLEVTVQAVGFGTDGSWRRFRLRASRVREAGRSVGTTDPQVGGDGRRRWIEVRAGASASLSLPASGAYDLEIEELRGPLAEKIRVGDFSPKRLVVGSASERVELVIGGSGR